MIDLFYKNVKILQSSQNCNKCCTDLGLHDYSHGQISLPILRHNLAEKRKKNGEPEIIKNLNELKKIVNNWCQKIDHYYKYEAVFGIDASMVYDFESIITNENVHKITCSQVYKLEQATRWRPISSMKQKQKQFQKQIGMDLQKYFKIFAKERVDKKLRQTPQAVPSIVQKISVERPNNQIQLKEISQEKPNSANKLKQNPQPKQQFMDITPSQSEQSNKEFKREQKDNPQQPKIADQPALPSPKIQVEKKKEQIKNEQKNVVYHDPTLKIQQLKYESTGKFFNVVVKVIRILKDFDFKGVKFYRFIAADDTGRGIFVTGSHLNIKVGKTIKITNCHLYIFHKQKQIKGTKHSKFEFQPDLPSINYNFDLSAFFGPRQAELPIKYIKIKEIQPGEEDLNMIVKIYQIIESKENRVICYLGDQTGIVKAKLSLNSFIKEGCSLRLLGVESAVVDQHILMLQGQNSKIIQDNTVFQVINIENDMSQEEWAQKDQ